MHVRAQAPRACCQSGCEDGTAETGSPSSGGNLPSDRHLTRRFYSCSKSQLRLYRRPPEKARGNREKCRILR